MNELLRLRARLALASLLALVLAACASWGTPQIVVGAPEIAARFAGLDRFTRQFEGLDVAGPQVGFMTESGRIELAWTAKVPGEGALPLSVRASLSGRPVLNESGDGIDLDEVRFDGLSLRGLPFLPALRETRGSAIAGRLPLMSFDPDELRRGDQLYRAEHLEVSSRGLVVMLVPR